MKLTGKKFLMLLLYSPTEEGGRVNEPVCGRTRLMKTVFLFEKELLDDFKKDAVFEEIELPEFFSWKYGPFSTELLNDLEFLINQDYIDIKYGGGTPITAELAEFEFWVEEIEIFGEKEYLEEVFSLSEKKGLVKGKEIWRLLSRNQERYLIAFKRVLNKAPLSRILDYVYKKYEKGYTDKSLIREKFLAKWKY